ncbi:MAG: amidophosphoribosyltransferase [Saccharofermentanaceae bacterium]|jgi:amidophosphoribosyltransferase|nr:amidophosphoribosyltransferase [Clostridia bacterium]NLX68284.1 amidophosphoribosyltransferase [Clostridiaceae bacterium]HOO49187.1 amidophosphoribosyltransferase [Saccharofermentans sp.]HPE28140.1 amidophosphoribosyltransferase [Saccharofermentans sp.]HPQ32428.1 amidophosphoribosyltransferase [Saccharofermentans sp.]
MSGLFGCIDTAKKPGNVARTAYYGVFSLQHRGQESAGIAVNNNGSFMVHKQTGLVADSFDDVILSTLEGSAAVGTARLASSKETGSDAIQPILIKSRAGNIALSSSSAILNESEIRDSLKNLGAIFQTNTDSEVILSLFSRNRVRTDDCESAILQTMKDIKGVYSMIFMTEEKLIGVRDPYGMRPLVLGRKDDIWMLSSETCALDALDAEFIRDLEPGEIISISNTGKITSTFFDDSEDSSEKRVNDGKVCIFEYVYVARPDSVIDGSSIYESRVKTGMALAKEHPCDCDLVIGAPDSGNAAALGYARQIGKPYGSGLLKNRYVGRTFIQGTQDQRELAVRMKFAVLKSAIAGKKICIVDDSLVRGTTTKHIIRFLRDSGAKEVHVRLASPEVKFPCCYGVNASDAKDLPAKTMSVEEIRDMIGADSLGYVSLASLKDSLEGIHCGVCSACFDGNYIAGKTTCSNQSVHSVIYTEV